MKKFSDFGIQVEDSSIFPVSKISISELLNQEIEILDFHSGIRTRHGDDRCVVKIKYLHLERKFFTNANPIKQALAQIPKENFPFLATIKQQNFGSNHTFYLT